MKWKNIQSAGTLATWSLYLTAFLAVALAAGHSIYAMKEQGSTWDEPFHYKWSERLIDERVTDRERLLYNSKTPISSFNVMFDRILQRFIDQPDKTNLQTRRAFSLFWLLGLFVVTYLVASRISGPLAGLTALILIALEPNLIAHSSFVTVDVVFSMAVLAVIGASLLWIDRPSALSASILGGAFGFALLTKFSALLLLPIIGILPIFIVWDRGLGSLRLKTLVLHGALVATVSSLIVCAGYMFIGIGVPLGNFEFHASIFKKLASWFGWLRFPLPADFISGIDYCFATERNEGRYRTIIFGQLLNHGVWYYFFVLWFFKTPVLMIAGQCAAVCAYLTSRELRGNRHLFLLTVAFSFFLFYFSVLFDTQTGYRYVFMCIPLLVVVVASVLATKLPLKILAIFLPALFFETHIGLLDYIGSPLSYTNLFVQDKKLAYQLFGDGNLDWRHNHNKIDRVVKEAGIDAVAIDPVHILPGVNVLSIHELWLGDLNRYYRRKHLWLIEHETPEGHLRHSHLWFRISEDQFRRFLRAERTLTPIAKPLRGCSSGRIVKSSEVMKPLALARSLRTVLCIEAEHNLYIRFKSEADDYFTLSLKKYDQNFVRLGLEQGQEIWYFLQKGQHSFAMKNTRTPVLLEVASAGGEQGA